jgi:chromosome segregation ATPase
LSKHRDDLNVELADETKRRQEAYDNNVSLNVQLKRTKDDLDLQTQLKLNIIEANIRESNGLNERISALTGERNDLTNDNTILNVDLSATRNNVDVLNSRIDTYHRIGHPYYYPGYPYNYPSYYPYSRYPYSYLTEREIELRTKYGLSLPY